MGFFGLIDSGISCWGLPAADGTRRRPSGHGAGGFIDIDDAILLPAPYDLATVTLCCDTSNFDAAVDFVLEQKLNAARTAAASQNLVYLLVDTSNSQVGPVAQSTPTVARRSLRRASTTQRRSTRVPRFEPCRVAGLEVGAQDLQVPAFRHNIVCAHCGVANSMSNALDKAATWRSGPHSNHHCFNCMHVLENLQWLASGFGFRRTTWRFSLLNPEPYAQVTVRAAYSRKVYETCFRLADVRCLTLETSPLKRLLGTCTFCVQARSVSSAGVSAEPQTFRIQVSSVRKKFDYLDSAVKFSKALREFLQLATPSACAKASQPLVRSPPSAPHGHPRPQLSPAPGSPPGLAVQPLAPLWPTLTRPCSSPVISDDHLSDYESGEDDSDQSLEMLEIQVRNTAHPQPQENVYVCHDDPLHLSTNQWGASSCYGKLSDFPIKDSEAGVKGLFRPAHPFMVMEKV